MPYLGEMFGGVFQNGQNLLVCPGGDFFCESLFCVRIYDRIIGEYCFDPIINQGN